MTLRDVNRRTLVRGSAWALPTLVVGAVAPAASASPLLTCPTASPLSVTARITVPADICAGGAFTGDFTFNFANPTTTTYWATPVEVQSRPFSFQTGPGPWSTATATFTDPMPVSVAPGLTVSGSGNIANFTQTSLVQYQLVYSVTGGDLPAQGCRYSLALGYGFHCE